MMKARSANCTRAACIEERFGVMAYFSRGSDGELTIMVLNGKAGAGPRIALKSCNCMTIVTSSATLTTADGETTGCLRNYKADT